MVRRLRKPDKFPSLNGKTVHILGPRVFQNALLANILTSATGVACDLCASMEELSVLPAGESREHLVLEDYLNFQTDGIHASLAHEYAAMHSRGLVAFFNLPGDWGRESLALRHGIRGLFYETDVPESLVKGVCHILAGEVWASRRAIAASFEEPREPPPSRKLRPAGLTAREIEILRLIVEGGSNEDMAGGLRISTHTVKTHLYNAFRKINAANRIQAARWATKHLP